MLGKANAVWHWRLKCKQLSVSVYQITNIKIGYQKTSIKKEVSESKYQMTYLKAIIKQKTNLKMLEVH